MCGVSLRYRIVFLSNHKTASTSVHQYLHNLGIIDLDLSQIKHPRMYQVPKHTRVQDVIAARPDFSNFTFIVAVRNPIDRAVSMLNFNSDHTPRNRPVNEALRQVAFSDEHPMGYKYFQRFVYNADGSPAHPKMVVLKSETIAQTLPCLLRQLGVPVGILRRSSVGRANLSETKGKCRSSVAKVTKADLDEDLRRDIVRYFRHDAIHYPDLAGYLA